MTGDANSGRRGLWTEAKWPGDSVRELTLYRGDEIGFIAIQQYTTTIKVGSFLPGISECPPGDTPKTRPEKSETFKSNGADAADALFDNYVQAAYADGWQNYHVGAANGL